MRRVLRVIRGSIGMGLAWGLVWSVAGLVPRWVLGIDADAPFPLVFGVLGFSAGLIFSWLLVVTAGRRRFDQMTLPRFAAWGATGGVLLSAVFTGVASPGWADMLALASALAAASATCASGSLALARRGRTLKSGPVIEVIPRG